MSAPTRAERITRIRDYLEHVSVQRLFNGDKLIAQCEWLLDELASADAREQQIRDLCERQYTAAYDLMNDILAIIGDKP